MPGTLQRLFECEEAALRAYGGVRKLFCGGEHISEGQRRFLTGFGVELIRSAMYGSVDAGPLGHACGHGRDGEFHLLADIQWLEILEQDSDRPAAPGAVGRLAFTSLAREGQPVRRYDLGDLGRWLPGRCGCGLPSPRFRLTGRHGALLRAGTIFVNQSNRAVRAAGPGFAMVGGPCRQRLRPYPGAGRRRRRAGARPPAATPDAERGRQRRPAATGSHRRPGQPVPASSAKRQDPAGVGPAPQHGAGAMKAAMDARLRRLVEHARAHSPFFTELYRALPEDWTLSDLPLIEPADYWSRCQPLVDWPVLSGPLADGHVFKDRRLHQRGQAVGVPPR
ncbi:hypothetical protein JOS77_13045 [Chromobacterium haemolyticum]|nr:hypothetical protein JOS77_13045 [Chromobacterium haemolyticum]